MAEFLNNAVQAVSLNQAAVFNSSIPCNRGNVFHADGTGNFILRGNTPNCFARYQVVFNGNIALPEGGTVPVGGIAVAISVNGETRPTSRAIYVPAAAGDENYGNVTSTAIITVPRGCCFNVSLRNVPASEDPTATPAPVINIQNANLIINRIA